MAGRLPRHNGRILDAYGFLSFKTFVSFMSGNTTHSGFSLGLVDAMPALLAIIFFVTGVFTGTLLKSFPSRSRRPLFGLIAVFLALTIGVTQLESFTGDVGIVLLSFTMGMINTALSYVGTQAVNLTFVTGTLNQIRRAPGARLQTRSPRGHSGEVG